MKTNKSSEITAYLSRVKNSWYLQYKGSKDVLELPIESDLYDAEAVKANIRQFLPGVNILLKMTKEEEKFYELKAHQQYFYGFTW